MGEKQRSIEREIDGNEDQIAHGLYRKANNSQQMQVSTCIERSVEEMLRKYTLTAEVSRRYRGSTHQILEQKLDRSTMYREAIEYTDLISDRKSVV